MRLTTWRAVPTLRRRAGSPTARGICGARSTSWCLVPTHSDPTRWLARTTVLAPCEVGPDGWLGWCGRAAPDRWGLGSLAARWRWWSPDCQCDASVEAA